MLIGLDTASVGGNLNPNWQQAKAAGLSYAIIRASENTWKDPVFDRDWPAMKAAGIVRGAYLFLHFNADPMAQVKTFCDAVKLEPGDLPPSVDVEFTKGRAALGIPASDCLNTLDKVFKALKETYGCSPMIYTSARVWEEDLGNLAPPAEVIDGPLWLARYFFTPGPAVQQTDWISNPKYNPPVPPPWGDSTNWWIHQYQGDATGFPGFSTGNFDLNRFNPMHQGMSGDRVKWVQKRLGVDVDGDFGGETDKAVRAFQQKNGLVADGIIGPKTFAFLARLA